MSNDLLSFEELEKIISNIPGIVFGYEMPLPKESTRLKFIIKARHSKELPSERNIYDYLFGRGLVESFVYVNEDDTNQGLVYVHKKYVVDVDDRSKVLYHIDYVGEVNDEDLPDQQYYWTGYDNY